MVSVQSQDDPYTWTAISGIVVAIETGQVAEAHIDFLSRKYDGVPWVSKPEQVRVIVEIRPHHVTFLRV